jgi:hypothetical protein
MNPKMPLPAAHIGAHRATGSEFLGRHSDPQSSSVDPENLATVSQQETVVRSNGEKTDIAAAREAQLTSVLTAIAMTGGAGVFQSTKRSAALHEAGHAVIFALEGIMPTRARIWPVIEDGCSEWVGRVDAPSAGRVDSKTPVNEDIRRARMILAGLVAEKLFDPDYRWESCIAEIAEARALTEFIAWKLERNDCSKLERDFIADVEKRLKSNEQIVRRIASELMRKGTIKSRRLAHLLKAVRRTSHEQ